MHQHGGGQDTHVNGVPRWAAETNTITGRPHPFGERLLELVHLQRRDEGDVIEAVVRGRLLLQLVGQIASQLHHGCLRAEGLKRRDRWLRSHSLTDRQIDIDRWIIIDRYQ